jgi:predicted ABC-class ATPase
VTITAEDGRAVSNLNISPFIKWIPNGDTKAFSTTHASGSTSQAANIMEAVEFGSTLLLIDEDRSATNFMIRDALMKELIVKEPITPFTDRVRELSRRGTSTVLVIGGSGEYLSVADKVYMMDEFVISDATLRAKEMALTASEPPPSAAWETERALMSDGFTSYPKGSGTERLEISDTGFIIIGDERIDVRALHNIATDAQLNALAFMLRFLECAADDGSELERLAFAMRGLEKKGNPRGLHIGERMSELYKRIEREGINVVDTGFFTTMDRFLDVPREFELRALINRMRRVSWR